MTTNFFSEVLQNTKSRIATSTSSATICLDKNEQSMDVDYEFKVRVIDSLLQIDWNRYPSADTKDIEMKIADYCQLKPENIVLAGGSATLITTLLNYFALNKKNIIIAQPSYSLFDYHCKTYNIHYTSWFLNADLEFDYENMPVLDKDSVFIITSPNNPTGNAIDINKLEELLQRYPESMVILDGVYTEFCQCDVTPLIHTYSNLIVLRSFSKAFPIAGLRLGYLCATPAVASVVKKLILQFSITPFSLCFAREILFDKRFIENSKKRVCEIILQRDLLSHSIATKFNGDVLKVFSSEGNFLLIKIFDDTHFNNLMEDLSAAGIKVLNTSGFALLQNTFRVSIGTDYENNCFLQCLINSLESNFFSNQLVTQNNPIAFSTN